MNLRNQLLLLVLGMEHFLLVPGTHLLLLVPGAQHQTDDKSGAEVGAGVENEVEMVNQIPSS